MQETEAIDNYIRSHIDDEGDYLRALYRIDIRIVALSPHGFRTLARAHAEDVRPHDTPKCILEIGTYSGYSAICMAEGLEEGGMLHTFEINDEQEDFTRPWLEGSPCADKIRFYIGDALELVPPPRPALRHGFH